VTGEPGRSKKAKLSRATMFVKQAVMSRLVSSSNALPSPASPSSVTCVALVVYAKAYGRVHEMQFVMQADRRRNLDNFLG